MPNYAMRVLDTSDSEILDLSEENGYAIRLLLIPEEVRRRDVVTSPDMDGEVERQSVLDAAVLEVLVSCRGANASAAWSLYDSLKSALNGDTRQFKVETTIHGRVRTWDARRAMAWRLDSDKARMRLHHRDVSMLIPVHPVAEEDAA